MGANSLHARTLMVQGTGSDTGKSLIVAGLCRAYSNRGLKVLPFKPQNMSNNAAVTHDGGEIGRAQALQARACRSDPITDMNPVLLKPEADTGAQLVVGGQVRGRVKPADFRTFKDTLLPDVLSAFERLKTQCDVVIVEGAGSPSETNLRAGDIANMGFATAANVPVILTGDVEKGGVIAQIVGTHAVLDKADRDLIKGFIINKFRGDGSLFAPAMIDMQSRTGWTGLGVVGWFSDAAKLPKEDSASLSSAFKTKPNAGPHLIRIAVPKFNRLANFDDLDPLSAEPNVEITLVEPGQAIAGNIDVVILAGSKSVLADLRDLKQNGWDVDIKAHVNRGGQVVGLCGGYQMLGHCIRDPLGLEGASGEEKGLGLLDIDTTLEREKTLTQISGTDIKSGHEVRGYEMHLGQTTGPDCARPCLQLEDDRLEGTRREGARLEGAMSLNGQIMGTYVHGIFAADDFRHAFLNQIRSGSALQSNYDASIDQTLDDLADHLESCLDLDQLLDLATREAK